MFEYIKTIALSMPRYECIVRPRWEFAGTAKDAENQMVAENAARDVFRNFQDGYRPHGVIGDTTIHLENQNDRCRKI